MERLVHGLLLSKHNVQYYQHIFASKGLLGILLVGHGEEATCLEVITSGHDLQLEGHGRHCGTVPSS